MTLIFIGITLLMVITVIIGYAALVVASDADDREEAMLEDEQPEDKG